MAPEVAKKKDPRAWDGLTPPLAEWILDAIFAMGFDRMTPVQVSTVPLVRFLIPICWIILGELGAWELFREAR
jgi:hypothetical protein